MEIDDVRFENFDPSEYHSRKNELINQLINSSKDNRKCLIELRETTINKRFNEFLGTYEKYHIIYKGEVLGYFECFKSNSNEYWNMFTSPLNSF